MPTFTSPPTVPHLIRSRIPLLQAHSNLNLSTHDQGRSSGAHAAATEPTSSKSSCEISVLSYNIWWGSCLVLGPHSLLPTLMHHSLTPPSFSSFFTSHRMEPVAVQDRMRGVGLVIEQCGLPDFILLQVSKREMAQGMEGSRARSTVFHLPAPSPPSLPVLLLPPPPLPPPITRRSPTAS